VEQKQKTLQEVWEFSSVVEVMLSLCKALDSISSSTKIKTKTYKTDTASKKLWKHIYRSIYNACTGLI
jgi:hypothetical protein